MAKHICGVECNRCGVQQISLSLPEIHVFLYSFRYMAARIPPPAAATWIQQQPPWPCPSAPPTVADVGNWAYFSAQVCSAKGGFRDEWLTLRRMPRH